MARSGPHERRSAARGRVLWAGGTIVGLGRGRALFLLVGATTQTVALEFDAVSIVDDAVQNGVAEGRVCKIARNSDPLRGNSRPVTTPFDVVCQRPSLWPQSAGKG